MVQRSFVVEIFKFVERSLNSSLAKKPDRNMYSHIFNNNCSSPTLTSEGSSNVVDYILLTIKSYDNAVAQVESETKRTIRFGEIIGKVNYLGNYLVNEGVKNGDVICLISKNSIDYCWLLLGALQSGAVCALYSPYTKSREINHFINTSKPRIVIAPELEEDQLNVLLNNTWVETIYTVTPGVHYDCKIKQFSELVCPEKNISSCSKLKIICKSDLYDPALILASSGSTGLPKGVVLTQNNIISALCHSKLLMRNGSVGLGLMPFFHAYGLGLMLMALCEGSKFITMCKFSMDKFLNNIQNHQISHLYLVPSLIASLGKSPNVTSQNLSFVREVFTGAGAITTNQQKSILKKLNPSAKLYHSYGMTETTFVVIFGEYREDKPSSSGRLIPGILAKVVSEDGDEVPTGQIGEMCLKGSLIMMGYHDNEKATKESKDEKGWLRTGDLVFKDIDGYFYIVERIKELIKYQGYQVSPTELELVLLENKAVAEVAVIGIPHEIYGEVPKAFIVKNPGYDVTEEDIKSALNNELSPYKQLKGGVQFLTELPKSPSGKILKKMLKDNIYKRL